MLPAAQLSSGGRIKCWEHPYEGNRSSHAETAYSRTASRNTEMLEAQLRLADRVRAMLVIVLNHSLSGTISKGNNNRKCASYTEALFVIATIST